MKHSMFSRACDSRPKGDLSLAPFIRNLALNTYIEAGKRVDNPLMPHNLLRLPVVSLSSFPFHFLVYFALIDRRSGLG